MLPVQWIIICYISMLQIKLTSAHYIGMYYYDSRNEDVHTPQDVDTDFDVLVPISLRRGNLKHDTISTGLYLDRSRILTAYNPYRRLIKSRKKLDQLSVVHRVGRVFYYNANIKRGKMYYKVEQRYIGCGRPIIYLTDEDIAKQNYTGVTKNNPLHDLMVLRYTNANTLPSIENAYKGNRSLDWKWFIHEEDMDMSFPALYIDLAKRDDKLSPDDMKMGSLEHREVYRIEHYIISRKLNVIYLTADDLTNCELWFPREWGYFICIRKAKNIVGLASGAILISNKKVFGIGCFALNKGQEGIYVFTDVRMYEEHIEKTCTDTDVP